MMRTVGITLRGVVLIWIVATLTAGFSALGGTAVASAAPYPPIPPTSSVASSIPLPPPPGVPTDVNELVGTRDGRVAAGSYPVQARTGAPERVRTSWWPVSAALLVVVAIAGAAVGVGVATRRRRRA